MGKPTTWDKVRQSMPRNGARLLESAVPVTQETKQDRFERRMRERQESRRADRALMTSRDKVAQANDRWLRDMQRKDAERKEMAARLARAGARPKLTVKLAQIRDRFAGEHGADRAAENRAAAQAVPLDALKAGIAPAVHPRPDRPAMGISVASGGVLVRPRRPPG